MPRPKSAPTLASSAMNSDDPRACAVQQYYALESPLPVAGDSLDFPRLLRFSSKPDEVRMYDKETGETIEQEELVPTPPRPLDNMVTKTRGIFTSCVDRYMQRALESATRTGHGDDDDASPDTLRRLVHRLLRRLHRIERRPGRTEELREQCARLAIARQLIQCRGHAGILHYREYLRDLLVHWFSRELCTEALVDLERMLS